ncbi:MAG: hypothetical protein KF803_06325 [Cyclobacteriaceae bacterium]|nr:hypothetical protein [Cyclobacteriaceae bacterium]
MAKKAVLVPLDKKDNDRMWADINRSTEDRIKVMFDLMRMAFMFSKESREVKNEKDDHLWWTLKRIRNV